MNRSLLAATCANCGKPVVKTPSIGWAHHPIMGVMCKDGVGTATAADDDRYMMDVPESLATRFAVENPFEKRRRDVRLGWLMILAFSAIFWGAVIAGIVYLV